MLLVIQVPRVLRGQRVRKVLRGLRVLLDKTAQASPSKGRSLKLVHHHSPAQPLVTCISTPTVTAGPGMAPPGLTLVLSRVLLAHKVLKVTQVPKALLVLRVLKVQQVPRVLRVLLAPKASKATLVLKVLKAPRALKAPKVSKD